MPRTVPEWIGKTDDTPIPPRVKLRIFEFFSGRCARCGNSIRGAILPRYDHKIALINGGENRESNLQLLCSGCHVDKSHSDVRQKSVVYRKRLKHIGIKKKKRLIPGSKGSGIRIRMDGTIWREND